MNSKEVLHYCQKLLLGKAPQKDIIYREEEYIIAAPNGLIIVGYWGSDSVKDWLKNAAIWPVNNEGFPKLWVPGPLSVVPDLVTGYSRGAALALIQGYYTGLPVLAFSPPKISTKILSWPVPPFLVAHADDVIKHVPPGYHYPRYYRSLWLPGAHTLKMRVSDHEDFYLDLDISIE